MVKKPTGSPGKSPTAKPSTWLPRPAALVFYQNHATEEAMTKKRKTSGKKRGPKEERLIVREDPADALARLLKPTKLPKRGN